MDCFVTALLAMTVEGNSLLTPPPFVIKHNYSEQDVIDPMGNAATAAAADRSALLKIEIDRLRC